MFSQLLNVLYNLFGYNKWLFYKIYNLFNYPEIQNIALNISYLFEIKYFTVAYFIFVILSFFMIRFKYCEFDKNMFVLTFENIFSLGSNIALTGLIYAYLKYNVNMIRPICDLNIDNIILNNIDYRCASSFPSAHVALSIVLVNFLQNYVSKKIRYLLFFLPVIVALSRIILAMHYPADVIYSVFIILFIICFSKFITNIIYSKFDKYILYIFNIN